MTLIVILVPVVGIWVWGHFELNRTRRRQPHLRAGTAVELPEDAPLLSVIIPAHNEERNLGRTLEALLVQDYPRFEVIVASDRSTDRTADIVREFAQRDPRVSLYENHSLPGRWTGRSHVLQKASETSQGDILLFLDADVATDPGALSTMVSYFLRNRLDMLSMFLRHESHDPWDRVMQVIVALFIAVHYPLKKINDPHSPVSLAVGQNIMIRTEVYKAIDRHEQIKSLGQDDMALARLVKGMGYRAQMAFGFDMASVQWYSSLKTAWSGWTRNTYGLTGGRVAKVLTGLVTMIYPILTPVICLLAGVTVMLVRGPETLTLTLTAMSLVTAAILTAFLLRVTMMTRVKSRAVLMYVPGAVVFMGVLLWCITQRVRSNEMVWRGKRYAIGPNGLQVAEDGAD